MVVCTVLAAVGVALTRLRLGRDGPSAGRARTGTVPLRVHTVAGATAVVLWVAMLVLGTATDVLSENAAALVGILALAAWWVTAGVGLMLLARWLPTSGKRAAGATADAWSRGPGLSLLAHLGVLVCVGVLTWGYATGTV